MDKTRDGKISLADAKNDQAEFKLNLSEIKKGDKKHGLKEQKNTLHNTEMVYKARNSLIEFFDDYFLMVSEAKLKQKTLTPKQMLQRLTTALVQIKGGNNSENLLNEIRQIIYSL